MNDNTLKALITYLERTYGNKYPSGRQDHGKWFPDTTEEAPCCLTIRSPSLKFPWPLWKHCRSLKHCCNLHGADQDEVRDMLKKKNMPLLLGLDLPFMQNRIAEVLAGKRKTLNGKLLKKDTTLT